MFSVPKGSQQFYKISDNFYINSSSLHLNVCRLQVGRSECREPGDKHSNYLRAIDSNLFWLVLSCMDRSLSLGLLKLKCGFREIIVRHTKQSFPMHYHDAYALCIACE